MQITEAAKKIAQQMMSDGNTPGSCMDISHFDWVPGVGLYGLERAYETFADESISAFLKEWIEKHRDEVNDKRTVNSTAPVMTILDFEGESAYDYVSRTADYIIYDAPRLENGALEHTVTEAGVKFTGQMWADTLFMVCIMLAKAGSRMKKEQYTKEAAKQLLLHHKILKDDKTGLFFHGYSEPLGNHLSAVRWARANAWITVSTVEILELLPDSFEGRELILRSLNEQVAAYEKYQSPEGLFHTVIDREDGYVEASASAAAAYGIFRGVRDGYIDKKYIGVAERAAAGMAAMISEDGIVKNVSGGTPIMENVEAYHGIEIIPTLYGQGLTLILLCELFKNGGSEL